MGMGINIAWIRETGESIQEVYDPGQDITQSAMSRCCKRSDTKCLQFIDPFGDAVFNQAQIPLLLQELNADLLQIREPRVRAQIEKVIRLVQQAVDQTHTYIKFIGD